MSLNQSYNLDALSANSARIKGNSMRNGSYNGATPIVVEKDVIVTDKKSPKFGGILWFIVIALVVGLLFFLFRPSLVLSTNQLTGVQSLDWGKLILWSVIISLVVVFILWLLRDTHKMF